MTHTDTYAFEKTHLHPRKHIEAIHIADMIARLAHDSGHPDEVQAAINRRLHDRKNDIWSQAEPAMPAITAENWIRCFVEVDGAFVTFSLPVIPPEMQRIPDAEQATEDAMTY